MVLRVFLIHLGKLDAAGDGAVFHGEGKRFPVLRQRDGVDLLGAEIRRGRLQLHHHIVSQRHLLEGEVSGGIGGHDLQSLIVRIVFGSGWEDAEHRPGQGLALGIDLAALDSAQAERIHNGLAIVQRKGAQLRALPIGAE